MKKAKWIWEHAADSPDEYVWFYKKFHTMGNPIWMDLSCDSNYELYINGRLAAFGQYADYPYDKVYDHIDLTSFCHAGENTLALLVWYFGNESSTYYKGLPGLIFEVSEEDEVIAFSDCNTLCKKAQDYVSGRQKMLTVQLGLSYTYDTRGYDGCHNPDFVPQDYHTAQELIDRPETMRLRPNHKLTIDSFAEAKCIDQTQQIYDLGRETVGYLGLRFRAMSGAVVNVSYGEKLTETDGVRAVPRIIGRRDFSVELIGNGEWFDFSNFMRRLGLRYLQISCETPVEIDSIGVYPTEYPVRVLPYSLDDPLRQSIYDTSVRTLRLCMFEHYEDCPWREQALYTLDSRNQMLCGYYAFEEYDFPKSVLTLIGRDRSDCGLLHICFPTQVNLYIPFFSLVYILQMEEYARYSKDLSLLIEFYPKLKTLISLFLDRTEEGLIPNFYGDKCYWNFYEWNPNLDGKPRSEVGKRFDLVLNAGVSLALQKMAQIAKWLQYEDDACLYRNEAERLNYRIHRDFFDPEEGLYQNVKGQTHYSELGNAMAVLCGAASTDVAQTICERLVHEHTLTKATLSMKTFLYDALLATDEEKYSAYILDELDRDYGYMLSCGATSFWEVLNVAEDFGDAGSLCHGWSAIPILYYHRLLGK